jgi:hypothetical protein
MDFWVSRCWHRVHLKVLEWDAGGKKPKLHRRYIGMTPGSEI